MTGLGKRRKQIEDKLVSIKPKTTLTAVYLESYSFLEVQIKVLSRYLKKIRYR